MEKVYIVMKNADFTEGRGPMLLHSLWEDGEDAIGYIQKQQGIFGSIQKVERNKYGKYAYCNGYEIQEKFVISKGSDIEAYQKQEVVQKALAKLTKEERSLLGLE